ncbi:MAG: GGDEF domain-containing protein [Acidobacteriaceae bacterium]
MFRELALGMAALGLGMGAIFPKFVMLFGVPRSLALSGMFVAATLSAGLAVGLFNYLLARRIIRPRLVLLNGKMQQVRQAMLNATYSGDWSACSPDFCSLPEESDDELGMVAHSYNELLRALYNAHNVETQIRTFRETLSSQLDLQDLGMQALGLLLALCDASGGVIVIERHGELLALAMQGMTQAEPILQSAALQRAMREPRLHRIKLPAGTAIDAVVAQFIPTDVLLAPILHHGVALGWVVLATAQAFRKEVEPLLPMLLQGLGLALNNATLHDDLQQVAALDPLTGVYNRRFGLKRLNEEVSRSERGQSPLGVVMLDLDHFKRINDTFGHLSGDRVLVRMATICRQQLREGDVLLRYGGEEFAVVMPGASLEDAHAVAERIRFAVAHSPMHLGDQTVKITLSAGVAASAGDMPMSADQLIAKADACLYAAKASGRDRVVGSGADEVLRVANLGDA